MRTFIPLLCLLGFAFAQQREGSFEIRVEPTAKVQTGVEVPFQILVRDARRQPVAHAKVTFEINTKEAIDAKLLDAPGTDPGVYIAKPVFSHPGEWSVFVEVEREGARSTRTKQVIVE